MHAGGARQQPGGGKPVARPQRPLVDEGGDPVADLAVDRERTLPVADDQEQGGTSTRAAAGHYAFRDLPAILPATAAGARAVDFGCGLPAAAFDLVLSAFTFDNIPDMAHKVALLRGLRALLAPKGRLVNLVSTPDIYTHEWASFTTRDFPENRLARSGDVVRIITTDHPDARPVEDIVCSDAAYREAYRLAGLAPVRVERPLARGDEPIDWVSETTVAPWAIYALKR